MNGKAICYGVSLKDLDAPDLLDVLHFFFEEDVGSLTTAEQADAREKTRTQLYASLYSKTYAYASTKNSTSYIDNSVVLPAEDDVEDNEMPTPLDPAARSASAFTKPYVPPTRMNSNPQRPFGTTLDGPLG